MANPTRDFGGIFFTETRSGTTVNVGGIFVTETTLSFVEADGASMGVWAFTADSAATETAFPFVE